MEKINIPPAALERETIITEGQIHPQLFDCVERLIEQLPDLKSRSYWTACAGETACEINTAKGSFYLGLNGFDEQIRVVDYRKENAFKKPVYKGPLTINSAGKAFQTLM
jgi:hypothetical protein